MGNWGGTDNFYCNLIFFIQEIVHCTIYWLNFGINNTILMVDLITQIPYNIVKRLKIKETYDLRKTFD
jgi:hypothetical protein